MAEKEERVGAQWASQTDAHLVGYAGRDPINPQQAASVEMQRRLLVAIRVFNTQSGQQAQTMIRLTWAIAGLTVVIAILTTVMLWKGGA